ncbi:MAG: DUF1080 domain-containing protein [Verrucomicrobia bacterium]|nr:DUF1080 domain-containing protein [Verrucomicrobiota bacterium]
MSTSARSHPVLRVLALCALLAGAAQAAPNETFLGRWALTLPNGAAGWLEIKKEKGYYDGALLWGGGSVLPVSSVVISDDTLIVTRTRNVERKDAAGKVVRTQQFTETITAKLEGNDTLRLTQLNPRNNGAGLDSAEFSGKRSLPLPPRPALAKVKFGEPIALLNGKDLAGWTRKEPSVDSAWVVEGGVLTNRVPPHAPGTPAKRFANLRTEREFTDFNLKLEVNVPAGSNSGVYLRGIYEIQVVDSFGKALDSHNMGALYSRITPTTAAEKKGGEWQTMDITLVDRHLTVVLNGIKIIDNQPVLGCTGGAMWSDESKPGPIYLQGDHGTVSYRNLVLRPVVK